MATLRRAVGDIQRRPRDWGPARHFRRSQTGATGADLPDLGLAPCRAAWPSCAAGGFHTWRRSSDDRSAWYHLWTARGGTRTRTTFTGHRILSPERLPFRHPGIRTSIGIEPVDDRTGTPENVHPNNGRFFASIATSPRLQSPFSGSPALRPRLHRRAASWSEPFIIPGRPRTFVAVRLIIS